MGEIADMMLDGTMCEACGEFLNDGEDGDGLPGYCSRECAESRGMSWEEEPRPKAKGQFIVVKKSTNLDGFSTTMNAISFNCMEEDNDAKGNPMFRLWYDEKPDSDFGKVTRRGTVVVLDKSLTTTVGKIIRKAGGIKGGN